MLRSICAIAAYEFRVHARNRWTTLFGGLFGVLALAISYIGLVIEGYAGVQGLERTTASLLTLALYMIPLIALTTSALTFVGDRGSMELLFSQPLTRAQILLGKVGGLFGAIVAAMLAGLGAAAVVIGAQAGADGFWKFLAFSSIASLLALVFVALGALLSVVASTRTRALGLAVSAWFFLVLFYDLIVIGAGFLLNERAGNLLVFLSLFGNPVDAARIAVLILVGGASSFGAAGAALLKFVGGSLAGVLLLIVTMIAWTIAPIALAQWRLNRRDL